MVLISKMINMKQIKNFIMKSLSAVCVITSMVLAVVFSVACNQEQIAESEAILPSEKEISLSPLEGSKTITIYADGTWMADVTDTWLSIDTYNGQGTMDVVLSYEANTSNEPREAKIIVKGSSLLSDIEIVVRQRNDRFKDISACSITDALAKEDKSLVKLATSQIVAFSKTGFVVSDNTASVFVEGLGEGLKLGDNVNITGEVVEANLLKAIKLEDAFFVSNSEVTYPEAIAPSESMTGVTYVKLEASLGTGNKLKVENKQVGIIYEPTEDYSSLILHDVAIYGYFIGLASGTPAFVVCKVEDLGDSDIVLQDLPYKDDFSWLEPFIADANSKLAASAKINNTVAEVTSSSDGAANIYTTLVSNGVMVLEELRARGYIDLNPDQKTIYLQDAYFKYGATSKTSGLVLPNFNISGSMDLFVSFKWCAHFGGTGKVDPVPMVIEIVEGPGAIVTAAGNASISDPVTSTQKDYEMFWNDASFKVVGATSETRIAYHPGESTSSYLRYYLDDLSVVSASEMVPADIVVSGLENDLITFEGLPEGPVSFSVKSSKDFSISVNASWLELSATEGLANETVNVTVTCDQSELATLRKAEITIKSGTTVKKIQVVQGSLGQTIEPFISIVGGNSATVDAKEGSFNVSVQSNVEYEVEISETWLSQAPATKAMVSVDELVFNRTQNTEEERVAKIRFYNTQYNIESVYTVTQLSVNAKLPVMWKVTDKNLYSTTWPVALKTKTVEGESGYINAVKGLGTIWFNNENGVANDTDTNGKCKLDINTENPRVFGVWKNDYCQFKVPGIVRAGKKVKISFETRVSKTHPKYWRLQYRDGEEWKDASTAQTVTVEGEGTVTYTHQMAPDGTTNIQVAATVTYATETQDIVFRFISVTAMQASGAGLLPAPNGGSWRLAVTDSTTDTWQPTIQYVE